MLLALIRHGIAEDPGPESGYRDEARRLTHRGVERMRKQAQGIAALDLSPAAIVCSPLVRCHQTADIIADRLHVPVRVHEGLRPGARADAVLGLAAEYPAATCLMICGHQPDLTLITSDLIAGGVVEYRKGSLGLLVLHQQRPGGAVLEALYPPGALRRLAG